MTNPAQHIRYRYRFGSACFDAAAMTLDIAGQPVELEPKPLELLGLLLSHGNEVMTKEELLESIWAGQVTVEHVLANAVTKLRKALAENAQFIQTQPKVGYRFVGDLSREAVGGVAVNRLELKAGHAVPHRPQFNVQQQLSCNPNNEIWLAEHRKTAELRVFKFGLQGSHLNVLKREMALARLLQQNLGERADICRLLDWNFEQLPFFLEYQYGGESLQRWAEQQSRLTAMPLTQRLQLALQLLDAVAACHQCGVLHKDLKPSNVLIAPRSDDFWQVRLTDFGVGTLLDPQRLADLDIHGLTRLVDDNQRSGSPLYLAPELLRGEAPTVKSDIYALGVLLYQLLCGDMRRPLTSQWQADIDDPLLCEDIALACHGDINQRIHSAAALAERIRKLPQRHAEQAETARQAQLAQQNLEAIKRLRAVRPWLMATLVALAVGLFSSLLLYRQALKAAQQTRLQAAKTQAIGNFLTDLLENANPHNPGSSGQVSVREALDRATTDIAAQFHDSPELESVIRQTAAQLYNSLGAYQAAATHSQRHVELLSQSMPATDQTLLMARYQLAEILANASQYEQAQQQLTQADINSEGLLEQHARLDYQASRAHARYHLLKAQIEDATSWLQRALLRIDPNEPGAQAATFRLNMDLAQCYSRLGEYQQAIDLLQALHSSSYQQAQISQASRASARLYLGAAYLYAGQYPQAETTLHQAIAALTEVFGQQSPQVLEAKGALGNLYATSGRWSDALPLVRAVREQTCQLQGDKHLSCMMQSGNEGVILLELQEPDAAAAQLEPAMQAFAERLGQDSPGVQVLGYYLACVRLAQHRYDLAAPLIQMLDPAKLTSGSPGEGWDARVEGLKARLLLGQGQQQEGQQRLQKAIDRMEALHMQDWIVTPFRQALSSH